MTLSEIKPQVAAGETFYKLLNWDGDTGKCIEKSYFLTHEEALSEASDTYPYFYEIAGVSFKAGTAGVKS